MILRRRTAGPRPWLGTRLGIGFVLAGSVLGVTGVAVAGNAPVSADDSRATVVQGNINACPAGEPQLVAGDTSSATQNGVTVTVTQLSSAQPNPYPAGGWTTLPAGTDVLTVTLPSGDTLTGDIYVKGGDGYNDYPGSALTSLIPPVNTGGNIAGLSHYLVCGTLGTPQPATGTVTVTKHVTGSGTGSDGPFAVTVDCGTGQVTNLSLDPGDTKDVPGITDGSSCTVTETDASQATSTTYRLDGGTATSSAPTFTVSGGQTRAVDITNDYASAHLTVTKHVSGTPPSGVTTFPITVDCGGTTTDLSLGDGDSQTVDAAGGTHCSVTETDSHGAVVTYSVNNGGPSGSAPSVTLANGQTTTVDVTNTFGSTTGSQVGSVKVSKEVTGSPPAGLGAFDMSLDCSGVVTPISVAAGDSQTVGGIPDGSSCTLTEPDNKGATSTTFSVNGGAPSATATFTVTANQQTDVVVDNDYAAAGTPQLTISKSAVPASGSFVHRGDEIDYTLDYANTGTADATGVSVTDTLPADVTPVPASLGSAVYDATTRTLTWTLGTLIAGATGTLSYAVTVDPGAANGERLVNVAAIVDPSSSTDSNSTVHTVTVPTGALTITKAVDHTSAEYGQDLTYTLHVAATGQVTEHNVTVIDRVPDHTSFVSASCATPCTATESGGVVTWHVGDLAAGTSKNLTLVVQIIRPATGNGRLPIETIRNRATASSTEDPNVPSNRVTTRVAAVLGERTHRNPPPSSHRVKPSSQASLPFTGSPSTQLTGLALLLVLAGSLLLAGTRLGRRRRD